MANDLTSAEGKDIVPDFMKNEVKGPTGFEGISSDCISIPFLRLAQTNTPQVSPGLGRLPGLEAGQYFNPTTGNIYDVPEFIILGFYRNYSVWKGEPPDSKFVKTLTVEDFDANYSKNTHRDDKSGKVVDADGNRYVDTRNFLVLSARHPEDGILLYCMSSSGIPASKKWLAKASAVRVSDASGAIVQAPMWSRVWELKASFVEKPKGKYFQVTDITDKGWISASLAQVAKLAFDEAQSYDRSRIAAVEPTVDEETPDWAK